MTVAQPHGVVVWFTGLPSAGKSTLAEAVRRELIRRGHSCVALDGDEVRAAIVPPHGYSPEGRTAFYTTLARLAALLCRQGHIVLVPATAHKLEYREIARELAGSFLEVLVDTAFRECEQRDSKGLYHRARSGQLEDFPGEAFEAPPAPDLVANGGHDLAGIARIVDRVMRVAS